MNMLISKKVIVSIILEIMLTTLIIPVFAATTITRYTKKTSVAVGKTEKVYATGVSGGNIYWYSSNENIKIMGGNNSYCSIKGMTAGNAQVIIKDVNKKELGRINIEVTKGTTSTSNNSLLGGRLGLFCNLITKGTETTVKIGSSILQSLLKGNTTAPVTSVMTPVVETDKSTSTVKESKTTTPVVKKEETDKSTSTVKESKTTDSWQTVYLTNYKATDDNNTNYGTAYAGTILKKGSNGKIGIVHPNVYKNSKGWYVYRAGGVDYVILARLKDNSGSYCGFEKKEIVRFKYDGEIYNGVILDCGGATRRYATLDIFREIDCNNCPGCIVSEAIGTNRFLDITTNYNAKENKILRY